MAVMCKNSLNSLYTILNTRNDSHKSKTVFEITRALSLLEVMYSHTRENNILDLVFTYNIMYYQVIYPIRMLVTMKAIWLSLTQLKID